MWQLIPLVMFLMISNGALAAGGGVHGGGGIAELSPTGGISKVHLLDFWESKEAIPESEDSVETQVLRALEKLKPLGKKYRHSVYDMALSFYQTIASPGFIVDNDPDEQP